ncbi:hypothetical protein ACP70R_039934 [Stipagrostis hirtigluma subsp. patula]
MASSSSASSAPASAGSVITVATPSTGGSAPGGVAAAAAAGGTGSPCAACKFLRRKCQPDCVFAPYFPPDNPQKFVHVHRVFGASNVTKILNDLHPCQREDAVNSLAYEADMRLRDPVYGCVGIISVLQHRVRLIHQELNRARYELSKLQAAAEAAAAASAAVGSSGAAAMADLVIGNPVPNSTQNFINIGHSTAAAIGGVNGGGPGFPEHSHFVNVPLLGRSYELEGEVAAAKTIVMNDGGGGGGGGYGFLYSSAMGAGHGAVSGLDPVGDGPFLKHGAAGGDERPTAAQ